MRRYGFVKRKCIPNLKLPRGLVNDISDYRNIKRRGSYSPFRNCVFILSWNEGHGFNAKVLGDDMSDIPMLYDINVDDDEFRDLQEFLLFDWMLGKDMNVFINKLKSRSVILSVARKGSVGFTSSDIIVFHEFGVFNPVKIGNIKRSIGKVNTEK